MKETKRKLEQQVRSLERELSEELPAALKKAIEMGDLRENAEYQTAKERQSFVQARLAQLRKRLSDLSMVDLRKLPEGRVSYGATVVVLNLATEKEATYRLGTSEEADVKAGLISTASPIGRSLMGKQEGDEVEIVTPRGKVAYEIVGLTTIHEKNGR